MTERTEASVGTLVFLLAVALLITLLIWAGHLRYKLRYPLPPIGSLTLPTNS